MSILPVSAKDYFRDFSMDLTDVVIIRGGSTIGTAQGLKNRENGKRYIHLMIDVDIQADDDILIEDEKFTVLKIAYDTYNGEKQLIKVFY